MSDLVEFLRARLAEDEEVARAATNHTGHWSWDHGYGRMCDDPTCEYGELLDEATPQEGVAGTVLMEVHGYDVKEPWQGAAHIARHDPARVLAEVEAKGEMVAEHSNDDGSCAVCTQPETFDEDVDGSREWTRYAKAHPCPTLRLLALPYSAHPDYRPEWSPTA